MVAHVKKHYYTNQNIPSQWNFNQIIKIAYDDNFKLGFKTIKSITLSKYGTEIINDSNKVIRKSSLCKIKFAINHKLFRKILVSNKMIKLAIKTFVIESQFI